MTTQMTTEHLAALDDAVATFNTMICDALVFKIDCADAKATVARLTEIRDHLKKQMEQPK